MEKINHRPEAEIYTSKVEKIRENEGVTSAFTHASPTHSSARASEATGQHKRI